MHLNELIEAAARQQIVWSRAQNELEFGTRLLRLPEGRQRAAERHACREVCGVMGEPGAGDAHGVLELAAPPVLFRELRKHNRRRILLDPASELLDAGVIGRHPPIVAPT